MGDCAVMACGHAHYLDVVLPSPRLYTTDNTTSIHQNFLRGDMGNGSYINPDQRWYGCTGSFRKNILDGVSDYSEVYDPVILGCLNLIIDGGKIYDFRPMTV
jgi:hypothetical protein